MTSLMTLRSALSMTRAVSQARIHPSTGSFLLREDNSNCRYRSDDGRDEPRHAYNCEHRHNCEHTRTALHGYNSKYRRKD